MGRTSMIDGVKVVDAQEHLTLKINPADVKKAKANKKDPNCCVAAAACKRQLQVDEVRVHLGRVYLRFSRGKWLRYITPPRLRQEIITFDRGGNFAPGEFVLAPPQPAKRLGKRRGGNKPFVRSGKKRRPYKLVQDVRAHA